MRQVKQLVRHGTRALGYDIVPYAPPKPGPVFPRDSSPSDRLILDRITPYTMTSMDRQMALINAARSQFWPTLS